MSSSPCSSPSSSSRHRVVISGLGIVSPAGVGAAPFWDTIAAGRSCATRLTRLPSMFHDSTPMGAQVPDLDLIADSKLRKFMDRSGAFAVLASSAALDDAGLDPRKPDSPQPELCIGTCAGALDWCESQFRKAVDSSIRLLHPFTSIVGYPGNLVALVTILLGLRTRGLVFSTRDAAGVDALGYAYHRVRSGAAPLVLAGAAEAPLTPAIYGLLDSAGLLSHREDAPTACRPFDESRDGLVLGEGSVMLVIEAYEHARARGVHIYSELTGYATGTSETRPLHRAMAEAALTTADVDYVSATGSALPDLDRDEANQVTTALGRDSDRVPVSAINGAIGYALGAAGLMQTAACLLAMQHDSLPPTTNCRRPDPACRLRHIRGAALRARPDTILQHSRSLLGESSAVFVHQRAGGA